MAKQRHNTLFVRHFCKVSLHAQAILVLLVVAAAPETTARHWLLWFFIDGSCQLRPNQIAVCLLAANLFYVPFLDINFFFSTFNQTSLAVAIR